MFVCLLFIRAPVLVDVKLCKIKKKTTNFTHFAPKIFHISHSKTVYIYIFATATVHIYTIIIAVYTIILLISHFAPFFLSLLHLQTNTDFFSPSSSSSSFDTHKHTHSDKPTQGCTKTHGLFDACALVLQQRSMHAGGGNLFDACCRGYFCDKGRKCENGPNLLLGSFEVFIGGESSPKFTMYRKQMLMVL